MDADAIARLETDIEELTLDYPRLTAIAERIDVMRAAARTGDIGRSGIQIVLGPSGSGKSRAVKAYVRRMREREKPAPGMHPVLHLELPPKTTNKSLGSAILSALGDPFPDKGTEDQIMRRARLNLKAAGVEVLVIDEIGHVIHRDECRRTAWSVTEQIKNLATQRVAQIVAMGTGDAQALLTANRQIGQRALPPMLIDGLDMADAYEATTFVEHCVALDCLLVERGHFHEHSGFGDPEVVSCLYEVSRGVIGTVSNVVRHAAERAMREGRRTVARTDLAHAVDVWAIPLGFCARNPFRIGAVGAVKAAWSESSQRT